MLLTWEHAHLFRLLARHGGDGASAVISLFASAVHGFTQLSVEPRLAHVGLVHLGISPVLLVLGGVEPCNQGGLDRRALLHSHAVGLEVDFLLPNDLLVASCCSNGCWMLRIVGAWISASSIAGSLRLYHCCCMK